MVFTHASVITITGLYRNDYAKSLAEVEAALYANNVQMVDNEIRKIIVDTAEVEITFITNTYVETMFPKILDSLSSNGYGDLKIFSDSSTQTTSY